MTRKNRDHVAVSTDSGIAWVFTVPSDVTTFADQSAELTRICTKLFDTFGDFLTPIGITYVIEMYSEGQIPLNGGDTVEPEKTVERKISNDAGLTVDDVLAGAEVDCSGVRWIPQLPFAHNRLKIRKNGKDEQISRKDCVLYEDGTSAGWQPTWDPLEVTVSHVENFEYDDIDSEFVYHISVDLRSDVWLERTEQGEINREYLSQFLERLGSTLPFERVGRELYGSSDFWVDLGIPSRVGDFDPKVIY